MRIHARLTVLAILAAGSARLLACGGDDASPAQGSDASLPHDGAGGDDGTGSGSDAGGDTAPPPPAPPSYCQGLVFYVSFDPSLDPQLGATKARASGGVGTGPGRYGNALALVDDAAVDGAAVYYDALDGGAPFYASTEGTVAFWFKNDPAQPAAPDLSYFRALVSANIPTAAGPAVARGTNLAFGAYVDLGLQALVTLDPIAAAPFLRRGDFNHWLAEWHVGDDAGDGGVALFAINGGVGEVVSDAGFDAASVDATVDDAGDFTTPYAARRAVKLPPYPPFGALRIGGNRFTTPQGQMDDLAIWSRMLDRAEIAALYASPTSLSARCALP